MTRTVTQASALALGWLLAAAAQAATPAISSRSHQLQHLDLNGDGQRDMLAQALRDGDDSWLSTDGGQRWQLLPVSESPQGRGWSRQQAVLLLADTEGQGRPALHYLPVRAAPGQIPQGTRLALGADGLPDSGSARPLTVADYPFVLHPEWYDYVVGDINGDGRADILAQARGDDAQAHWLLSSAAVTPDASPQAPRLHPFQLPGLDRAGLQHSGSAFTLADVNNDGRADLIWQHPTASRQVPRVFLSQGEARFSEQALSWPRVLQALDWSAAAVRLRATDLDGDGKSELQRLMRPGYRDPLGGLGGEPGSELGALRFGDAGTITPLAPPSGTPGTPTGVSITPSTSSTGQFTLSWNAVPYASSYIVWRSTAGGSYYLHDDAVWSTSLISTHAYTGTHSFKVQACNIDYQCGLHSAAVSFTVSLAALSAPSGFSNQGTERTNGSLTNVRIDDNRSFSLLWNAVSGASRYEVEQAQHYPNSGTILLSVTGTSWTGPTAYGEYGFRVRACRDSSGASCGPWSSDQQIDVALPAPTGLTPVGVNVLGNPAQDYDGQYSFTWNSVGAPLTHYGLFENANQPNQQFWAFYTNSGAPSPLPRPSGQTYGYTVKSCMNRSCGPHSTEQRVAVTGTPATIQSFEATPSATNQPGEPVTLRWTTQNATSCSINQAVGSVPVNSERGVNPTAPVTYTLSCSGGGVTVSRDAPVAVNRPPVANALSASTPHNTPVTRRITYTDADGNTAYVHDIINPAGGSCTHSGLDITFTPTNGFSGEGRCDIRLTDYKALSGYARFTVTVAAPTSQPPVTAPTLSHSGVENTGTSPVTDTNGSYTVSWGTVATATRYEFTENSSLLQNNGNTSYPAFSNKANGSYSYAVKACNSAGCGPASTLAIKVEKSQAPSILTYTSDKTALSLGQTAYLSWSTQHASACSLNGSSVAVNANNHPVTPTATGTVGYTLSCSGAVTPSASQTLNLSVTSGAPLVPANLRLEDVENLATTPPADTDGAYRLRWDASSGATRYELYEGSTKIYDSSGTSHPQSGKAFATTWSYSVKACNASGCSAASAAISVQVQRVPGAPGTVSFSNVENTTSTPVTDTNGTYTVTRPTVSTATRYEHYENGVKYYDGADTAKSRTNPDGDYSYYVRACNAWGCGQPGSARTVRVQRAATETVTYLHSDTLGNVIGESKADGSFTRYHYKPYGERVESAPERLGFTGHLHQKELGLTYMQARHFDPLMGRFYGNDPVGFTGDPMSFNRYGYGNNNPYKWTDPTGMAACLSRGFGEGVNCAEPMDDPTGKSRGGRDPRQFALDDGDECYFIACEPGEFVPQYAKDNVFTPAGEAVGEFYSGWASLSMTAMGGVAEYGATTLITRLGGPVGRLLNASRFERFLGTKGGALQFSNSGNSSAVYEGLKKALGAQSGGVLVRAGGVRTFRVGNRVFTLRGDSSKSGTTISIKTDGNPQQIVIRFGGK